MSALCGISRFAFYHYRTSKGINISTGIRNMLVRITAVGITELSLRIQGCCSLYYLVFPEERTIRPFRGSVVFRALSVGTILLTLYSPTTDCQQP